MNSTNMTNNWNWVSTRTTKTNIIKTYPEGKTVKEVHARTEVDHPERTWDWTVDEKKREVSIFQNHWRVKEEEDLARGKTQEKIWEEEAIGKCLRMAKIMRDSGGKCENADGTDDPSFGVELTKQVWVMNKMRGSTFAGRPPMSEADARAEVDKAFADYIAEYLSEEELCEECEEVIPGKVYTKWGVCSRIRVCEDCK
jgi:hypothetical protein